MLNNNPNQKLRILYLSHERKMGGANYSLFELAREMKRRGHCVHVAVMYRGCPLDRNLREAGIKTFPCFYGWWQVPANWNFLLKSAFSLLHRTEFLAIWKLRRYARKNQIDIIHSNSSCIDVGAKAAKAAGIKHVWHFREYGKPDYNLDYLNGREQSISFVKKNSDKVIFISKALRQFYHDMDNALIAKIVYNGISEKYVSNSKAHNETPVFLVTGNLSSTKNQMLTLQAAKILSDSGVHNFRLQLAGESTSLQTSKSYKEDLIRFIDENRLENVTMLGYVKNMTKLREQTDVEIVASVSEAFGRVTVEAMFAKNPVIASDAGANPELVENGVTGLIFHTMDAESLAEQMRILIENPSLIPNMGENAFQYAKERYTIGCNAENIEGIYYELISLPS